MPYSVRPLPHLPNTAAIDVAVSAFRSDLRLLCDNAMAFHRALEILRTQRLRMVRVDAHVAFPCRRQFQLEFAAPVSGSNPRHSSRSAFGAHEREQGSRERVTACECECGKRSSAACGRVRRASVACVFGARVYG